MLQADQIFQNRMDVAYTPRINAFFEELARLGFTEKELRAVPSLFLPGWGDGYITSALKIAIAGKETLYWGTDISDSLLADLEAHKSNSYKTYFSCKRFRDQGPADWMNKFWHYAAASIGEVFNQGKFEILDKKSPVLNSIAWFNGHAIETFDSGGVDHGDISPERMRTLQELADKHGLSSFELFVNVFKPHVILYFYRSNSATRNLTEEDGCEYRQTWGDNDDIIEYQMGSTLILNLRHTSWMTRGNMKEKACAELIAHVMKVRGLYNRLPGSSTQHYNVETMSAISWCNWVSLVRDEAALYPDINDWDLSRHLILTVARELRKTNSTMTAQTLVLILNEVIKFQNDCWQYSPERRGPCSSVRGAYNAYVHSGKQKDATIIAEAFTKLNGGKAYE